MFYPVSSQQQNCAYCLLVARTVYGGQAHGHISSTQQALLHCVLVDFVCDHTLFMSSQYDC
jgi:hypothetical protein